MGSDASTLRQAGGGATRWKVTDDLESVVVLMTPLTLRIESLLMREMGLQEELLAHHCINICRCLSEVLRSLQD